MPDPEYTPTVDQAKRAYVTGMRQAFIGSAGEHEEEFARFLAAIRAAALDEAAEVVSEHFGEIENDDWLIWQVLEVASAIRALKEEKK